MKPKLYVLLAGLLLFCGQLKAQAPNLFNYQGVARDALGTQLQNQKIGLRFTIHQTSSLGATVYSETDTVTTNEFGLFTISIGSGTVTSGSMATISWGTNNYYLEIEMDPTGGTNYTDLGAQQLLSVPYALYAQSAGSSNSNTKFVAGTGIAINDSLIGAQVDSALWNANKLQGDSVSITVPTTGQVLQWNGTAWTPSTQIVVTDATLIGNGTAASKLGLAQNGASNGQVLEWNGTAWAPATAASGGGKAWNLTGNAGTHYPTSYIGTTDDNGIQFEVDGQEAGLVENNAVSDSGGYGNTGLGYQALLNSWGNGGSESNGIGYQTLYNNAGGNSDALGYQALYSNGYGNWNDAVGSGALYYNQLASYNVAIGYMSEYNNDFDGLGSAQYNTAVGANTLLGIFDGSYNTALGYNANVGSDPLTNATAIGANATVNSSNTVQLGSLASVQFDLALMPGGNAGLTGQVLQSNGAGVAPTWVTPSATGTVTSVGSGFGIQGGTITTTGTLSIDTSRQVGVGIPTIYFVDSTISANVSSQLAQPNEQLVYGTGSGVTSSSNLVYDGTNLQVQNGGLILGGAQSLYLSNGDPNWVMFKNNLSGKYATDAMIIQHGTSTGDAFVVQDDGGNEDLEISEQGSAALITFNNAYTFPVTDGTVGQALTTDGAGNLSWATPATPTPAWDLTGNNGTTYGTDFIGTTNDQGLEFKINNSEAGRIEDITTGTGATAFGYQALETVSSSSIYNTAFGFRALNIDSGTANLGVGSYALRTVSGSYNTAVGSGSQSSRVDANVTGNYNTGLGSYSLWSLYNGSNNTASGYLAEKRLVNGNDNAAYGVSALGNSNGSFNTAIGDSTLASDNSGTYNTALGYNANVTVNNLTNSTVIGSGATVSTSNTMVLGNNNVTALDINGALSPWTGSGYNSGTFGQVLQSNGAGVAPTWVAPTDVSGIAWALTGNSGTTYGTNYIGTHDNANLMFKIGNSEAGRIENATTANTALGYNALFNLGSGGENTGVGVYSLYSDVDGSNNTALGYEAGFNAEDNGNPSSEITLIGSQALLNNLPGAINNATVIGYEAEGDSSNSVVLGNHSVTQLDFNGALATWNGTNYNQGTAGQVLQSNGLGVAPTWVSPTTGTVTSVGSGFGIQGGTITTTGTLSIDTSRQAGVGIPTIYFVDSTVSANVSSQLTQPNTQLVYGTGSGVTSSSNLTYDGTNVSLTAGSFAINNAQALYLNGIGDTKWNISRNLGNGKTVTSNSIQLTYADGPGEGLIAQTNNGKTEFEILGTTGAITFDTAYTFPTTDGTIGQVLTTDGSGGVSWATPLTSGGTVTSVGSGFGIQGGTITASGTLSIDTSRQAGVGIPTVYFVDSSISASTAQLIQPSQQLVYGTGSGVTSSPNLLYTGQLYLTGSTNYGVINVVPSSDGSEASIGFWNGTGDISHAFVVGMNVNNLATGGFGIFDYADGSGGQNVIDIPNDATGAVRFDQAYTFPTGDGTIGQVLSTDGAGNVSWATPSANAWSLTGNSGTTYGTNFIGTADNQSLMFEIAGVPSGRIENNVTGNQNTSIGYAALQIPNGSNNVGMGAFALNVVYGSGNTGIGFESEYSNEVNDVSGNNNTGLGSFSLLNIASGNNNTASGSLAMRNLLYGSDNTALGSSALLNSNGSNNTAIGDSALVTDNSGTYNTALGYNADVTTNGLTNSTVIGNGARVGASNTIVLGNNNVTALDINGALSPWTGSAYDPGTAGEVLQSNGADVAPTWVTPGAGGGWALTGNSGTTYGANFIGTTDDNGIQFRVDNSIAGMVEDGNNSNGSYGNTGLGYQALSNDFNTGGSQNTAMGYQSLYGNQIAASNTAVGYQSLYSNDNDGSGNGIQNTALGQQALYSSIDDANNVAIGYQALYNDGSDDNTSANYNTAVGTSALSNDVDGSSNTAIGFNANFSSSDEGNPINNSTAIGANAIVNTSNTVQLGRFASVQFDYALMPGGNAGTSGQVLQSNGAGVAPTWVTPTGGAASLTSTQIGYGSGSNTLTSDGNFIRSDEGILVSDGYDDLFIGGNNIAGNDNTFQDDGGAGTENIGIGSGTLDNVNSGGYNIAIGAGSSSGDYDGNNNVSLGYNALATNNNGSNLMALGYKADVSKDFLTNSIALGDSAIITASNQFVVNPTIINWNIGGVSYAIPTSQGSTNTVLTNDGSGNLSWATPVSSTGVAEFVQTTLIPNNSVPVGTAFTIGTQVINTTPSSIIASSGDGGTVFELAPGTYSIEYEMSLNAAGSIALYTGASPIGLAVDNNTVAGSSTATTWIHGKAFETVTTAPYFIAVSPVVATAGVATAGTDAGNYMVRLTITKLQ